jgi:hypothetical protein
MKQTAGRIEVRRLEAQLLKQLNPSNYYQPRKKQERVNTPVSLGITSFKTTIFHSSVLFVEMSLLIFYDVIIFL